MDLAQLQQLLAGSGAGSMSGVGDSLLEFKAGLCQYDSTTRTVTADSRKGKIVLTHEDTLLHFKWKIRPHDHVEEDIIIMPGDAKLEKVPECADGRVFLVQFTSHHRRIFFWMQESLQDNDEQIFKAITEYFAGTRQRRTVLGQPDSAATSSNSDAASSNASGQAPAHPNAANNEFNLNTLGIDQTQLMSLLTGQLQQQQGQQPSRSAAAASIREMAIAHHDRSLNAIIDPELIAPLLEDEDLVQALLPHLPEGQQTKRGLQDNLRSPQLQQTLARLTGALNEGHADALLTQLGLPRNQQIGVDALISALKEQATKIKEQRDGDDTNMN